MKDTVFFSCRATAIHLEHVRRESTVTGLDLLLMKITMLNKLELKIRSEPSLFPVL